MQKIHNYATNCCIIHFFWKKFRFFTSNIVESKTEVFMEKEKAVPSGGGWNFVYSKED